jgi:hypothetical protein
VQQRPEFQRANAGFAHEYQLVDVQDFNGIGESQPNPYFYQVCAGFPGRIITQRCLLCDMPPMDILSIVDCFVCMKACGDS